MKCTELLATAVGAEALTSHAAPAIELAPMPATASPVNVPPQWRHGVLMDIFVRGHQDNNGDGRRCPT
jgi:hypothetical protein